MFEFHTFAIFLEKNATLEESFWEKMFFAKFPNEIVPSSQTAMQDFQKSGTKSSTESGTEKNATLFSVAFFFYYSITISICKYPIYMDLR